MSRRTQSVEATADRIEDGSCGNLRYAAITHVGMVRHRNEDAFLVHQERGFFALADGMGGHHRGDVAAALALETVSSYLDSRAARLRGLLPGGGTEGLIRQGYAAAHRAVSRSAIGGGTTLDLLLVRKQQAFIGHVGDGRIYLFRGRRLQQVTADHTVAAEAATSGRMNAAEARKMEDAEVLSRALSVDAISAKPDHLKVAVRPGDALLLATDGLTGPVEDDRISLALSRSLPDAKAACRELVALALAHGGPDNVTVIVVSVVSSAH